MLSTLKKGTRSQRLSTPIKEERRERKDKIIKIRRRKRTLRRQPKRKKRRRKSQSIVFSQGSKRILLKSRSRLSRQQLKKLMKNS